MTTPTSKHRPEKPGEDGKKPCQFALSRLAMMTRLSPQGHSAPPLHLAASNREVNSLLSLLSAGADPDIRNQRGQTALHSLIIGWPRVLAHNAGSKFHNGRASAEGQAERRLRLLCEHGTDVNAEVRRRWSSVSAKLRIKLSRKFFNEVNNKSTAPPRWKEGPRSTSACATQPRLQCTSWPATAPTSTPSTAAG